MWRISVLYYFGVNKKMLFSHWEKMNILCFIDSTIKNLNFGIKFFNTGKHLPLTKICLFTLTCSLTFVYKYVPAFAIIMVSKGTQFLVTCAPLGLVCNKARKHWREKDFLFNFLAAVLLNIVTQSTEGSIKTHLSLQFLKMNSNSSLCISCFQENGKRFLGTNRKIS